MDANNINFRAYNKNTKQWVHGPGKEVNIFGENMVLGGFMKDTSLEDLNHCVVLMDTGLTDKNGKSIYDGDIFKIDNSPSYYVVRYDYAIASFVFEEVNRECWFHLKFIHTQGVVVGNIFDNHDLLNINL